MISFLNESVSNTIFCGSPINAVYVSTPSLTSFTVTTPIGAIIGSFADVSNSSPSFTYIIGISGYCVVANLSTVIAAVIIMFVPKLIEFRL